MASESRTGGQINFVWSAPDDTGGIPITKYRVYMADSQGTKQIAASNSHPVTRVSVYSNLLADTAYDFYLQAGNELIDNDGWGDISASFKFSTGDVTLPGPVILHSGHYEGNTGGKVVLDWDAPLDTGGALISSYTIFASNSSVPWFETVATYADSGLSAAVTQLSASTAYQFVVLGNNSVLPIKLPGSMSISQGSSVMRTTVDLSSWLSVGSVIKVVGSVFVVGNVSAAATNTISLTSAHLSTTILSQPGELLGQATNVTTQSTTAPTFPDPPPAPISPIRTGGMISFTVLSPDDTGGIQILDFVIFQNGKKLSEDSYEKVIFTVPKSFLISSFISVASLEPLTSYNFSALALNSRSLCNFAPIVGPERMFSTTDVSAPGMPMLAKYKTTGGGITMTIINPHDTGGKDIQSYRLYYKEDVLASPWQLGYNGSKHQATVAHLKPITNYAFRASVNNGYFDSVNSSILVVRTTDKSPPGACDPAQPVSATGGMLEVSWDYPPDDGGETVTHYYATIASHLDGSGRMGVKTTNKSCVFYRLLALSSYDVTIRAGNSYGYGPESAIATFDTKGVTPPTGEIKVNVELTSGGAASISFDEPIDLGGVEQSQMTYNFYLDRDNIVNISYSALKEFPVGSIGGSRRLQDVDHRRLQTSEIFSNILVGGMDPETLYGLQILPLSSYSSGEISSSFAVATTVPTIPSAPVALKYDNVTGGSVSLSWGEPADLGGVPLNGYSLYISNVSKSGPFTSKGDDLQTTGITIYGLVPSSKYWAYVNASNDIGTSPSSAVIPFTTRTISAPSSPRNIQITSVGFDSIECVWDAPNDFGGDVINGFIVTATETDSSTSPIEFPVFGLSAVLTGLTSDTAYSIYVATLNTLGDPSPASVTRYAKTSSGPEIVSKPQIGCVSANSVELFWYPYPAASNYHVFRDGTDIGTTTSSMFTNTGVLSSLTSYTIQTASLAGSSEPVVVTTIDPHYTTADVRCQGKSGHITELSYANNVSKRWVIDPTSRYAYITLKFSSFFLECDHDYVEILDAGSSVSLWKGGCVRTGRFDIQAESSVVVRFHSDDSVAQKGFELTYEIDGDSEDVIVVSGEFGDDVKGTGQMMNASEKGTASKAVKTISRAVELSTRGSAILVYPGSYSGLLNRDLKISSSNLTITTLKGPFWTTIDCEQASRFAQSTSSILVVEGLSLQNCIASDGGVFSIADGNFTGGNMLITNSRAVERGGALYTSGSNVTLDHVRIVQISAGADGGALHFVDSNVSMISSNVTKSTALRGGAVALRGISILSTTDTTFEDNNATGSGGAAYVNGDISLDGVQLLKNKAPNGGGLAMDNGILTMENCIVENNSAAITGGGLLLSGASTVIATATSIHSNVAGTSGGGVYASGTINVNFDKQMTAPSTIMGNTALRGAGMYIFESNATFGGIQVENGSANESAESGGGILLNGTTATIRGCSVVNNSATFGGDAAVYIRNSTLHRGYAFNFGAGIFAVTTKLDISDSIFYDNFAFFGGGGIFIKDGGSGSLTSTTTRQLASGSTADTPESLYSSLIKPNSTVRWPTVVVRDYYGAIASYDNVTRCRATLASDETASFTFNPATWILVDEGYIVFEGAEVLSNFRDTPYQLNVSCTLSPVVQSPLLVDITVDKCNPGYENVRGLCKPCVKGKYSLDGGKCYLCPAGATCEGKDESGTTIGVVFPQRQEGYFMAKTRSTYATSNCDSPDSWPSNDPCKAINQTNLADLLLNCSGDAENFAKFWGRNRIFSCLSGHEYYACDTNTACVEAPNVSVSTASSQVIDQCAVGYTGVVCATCADGYYKGSSGTCKLCHDPNDPTVHRTTHLLAMLPLVVAAVAFVFLCYLFTNAAEQRVVSHAQAAKRFQIYRNQSRSRALLLAAKARIERKAYAMMQAIVKRLRSKPPLFHIERRHFHVTWSPEKLKIMLGFFQVMGSFKEVYEIPWPDNMSHLMDICSLADFNFVDTTAAECLFKRDYFANYRLALFALLGMLALVFLVTFWGVLKYRVKLSTLPRHCVSCGLPVFALEHGSPNLLARRATLLTELKMEQKSRSESVEKNELNLLARVKSNFSMSSNQAFERANSSRVVQLVVRALNWVDRMTQLPASISTHKPRCPTSQRIKNEVRDMVVHSNIRLWRARVWMRLYYKAYQNRCIKLFFWVLLLFYPMLCQRVIGTFYCDEVGEHYYLTLDRSILCYEGTWLYYLPVSISLVVFWVFGVPLLFWVIISMKRSRGVSDTILLITHPSQDALKKSLLLKMRLDIADHGHVVNEEEIKLFETEMLTHFLRDRNLNEPSTVAQVGFIYHSYDTHFWWFEVWDLGRKLLLNCVISLLAKAGANRIICGLVVMLMYLSVMLFYQPSRDRSDSALAGVTNIQLFITLFCGLILKMGALYLDARVVQLVTSVAVVSNILTLIYAVYSILSTPWKMARRRNREDYRRALAAHVRKLWQSAYGYALTEVYLSNPDRGPMPLLVKNELARREKYQQEMDDLNAQLELTSAMLPPPSPVEHHEEILTASQVDVLEDEDAAPGAASQADALDEDVDPEEQTRTGEAVDAAPQAVDS
ncbi:hypothetical protein PF005_g3275 [Phytophthora fragariae]|uniref:Uncharacterized protein n=1 Tax=Phytophthora fragariae TaxID=53985 RepID=A0A6A3Z8J2_9STRA|nr:hypothetical protein PF005_g3275 [Phytophthora fragariae]